MQIHGFNKTTLLDYPGLVAATIFTGACNFRCPFCQNADLVLNPASLPLISEEEVLSHLKKRRGITKGICITGGEPTLQQDLEAFIVKLKELDLKVKLDTNGYRPEVLRALIDKGLIDYVAMDIKSSLSKYEPAAGVALNTAMIKESVDIILEGKIAYEFRTTVMRELHNREVFEEIAKLIKGADKYFLQGYVESERVIKPGFTAYSHGELKEFLPIFHGNVNRVEIRGVE